MQTKTLIENIIFYVLTKCNNNTECGECYKNTIPKDIKNLTGLIDYNTTIADKYFREKRKTVIKYMKETDKNAKDELLEEIKDSITHYIPIVISIGSTHNEKIKNIIDEFIVARFNNEVVKQHYSSDQISSLIR